MFEDSLSTYYLSLSLFCPAVIKLSSEHVKSQRSEELVKPIVHDFGRSANRNLESRRLRIDPSLQ